MPPILMGCRCMARGPRLPHLSVGGRGFCLRGSLRSRSVGQIAVRWNPQAARLHLEAASTELTRFFIVIPSKTQASRSTFVEFDNPVLFVEVKFIIFCSQKCNNTKSTVLRCAFPLFINFTKCIKILSGCHLVVLAFFRKTCKNVAGFVIIEDNLIDFCERGHHRR